MSEKNHFEELVQGVASRAIKARRRARFMPRKKRQKFIYDQTFRNDIEAVAYPIAANTGKLPDFENPRTYLEKMRSLYLTHPNPLLSLAACKIEMRKLCEYAETPIKPAEMYGAYTDPAELDLTTLPETCYLKIAGGCKMNLAHARGMPITPLAYRIFLREWWQFDHWRRQNELHYRDIPRRLLVEEALSPEKSLRETCVFCAFGEPYVYYQFGENPDGSGRFKGHTPLDDRYGELALRYGKPLPPELRDTSDDMEAKLDTAKRLSRGLVHCRVDFLQNRERTVVGELTLSPGGLWSPDRRMAQEEARGDLFDPDRFDDVLEEGKRIAADLGWPVETSFGHFRGDPRLVTGGQ